MITPGHGQSRTNGDLSGPAGLQRPGQEGVIGPLPRANPGGQDFYRGQDPSPEGGLISAHRSLWEPAGGGI